MKAVGETLGKRLCTVYLLLLFAPFDLASHTYVQLLVRLVEAEAVVVGELVEVLSEGKYWVGTIRVTETLKGTETTNAFDLVWAKSRW